MIVSSREGGVRESEGALLSAFEHCRIARFTPSAILQFFRSLYATSAPHDEAERLALGLYERLQANPDLLDAVSSPLLAAISALIWSSEGSLPAQQVTLYERYCRILIQDWEQHHSVSYVGKLASVGWQTQLRLLAVVAFQVHSGALRNGATSEGIVPHLARALQEEGVCANPAQARWEAEQFLAALGVRSGLLQRQGADLYVFPHRTFQEYLTARHIATFDLDRCTDLLMGHLHEEWWREVHLLTIGHLGSEGGTGSEPVRLIESLLRAYAPPGAPRLPRRARVAWLGRLRSRADLGRRLAAALEREYELAARAYLECARERVREVEPELFARAESVIARMVRDSSLYEGLPTVRAVSVRLLARQPELIVPLLLHTLGAPDGRTRDVAATLLGSLSHPTDAVLAGLIGALNDDSIFVRRRALDGISQLGRWTPEVRRALEASLQSGTIEADSAAETLVTLGQSHGEALHLLIDALESDNDILRWSVEKHLGRAKHSARAAAEPLLQALARTLGDHSDVEQLKILASLGALAQEDAGVVDVLSGALRREDADVRLAAALALVRIGRVDERSAAELLCGLGSGNAHVRRWMARAIGELLPPPPDLIRELELLLEDADPYVRLEAGCSLARLGVLDPRAEAILVQALYAEQSPIQARTARSLAALPDVSAKVVHALVYAHEDGDSSVEKAVEGSLTALGRRSPVVAEVLEQVLAGEHRRLWGAAARILREIGAPAGANTALLLARLDETAGAKREETVIALGMLGDGRDEVIAALLRMLAHHGSSPFDWLVRSEAATSLGRLGRATDPVVTALCDAAERDPHDTVRRAALDSLGRLNLSGARVGRTLRRSLGTAGTQLSALRAVRGLRVEETDLPGLLPALHECLDDREDEVRVQALLSLQQMLAGRSIPGYRWKSRVSRRTRRRRHRGVAAAVAGAAAIVLIAVASSRWIEPGSSLVKTLVIIAAIVAFLAGIAEFTGWTVREGIERWRDRYGGGAG